MSSTTLLATDQQRSVLVTLKANHSPQSIAYSPYGHRPAACWLLSSLGFNGELADPVTGYYLLGNGYRAFNPVLLRFNLPDSFCPFGEGGLNSYVYCLGDPRNLKDPTGHLPQAFWSKVKLHLITNSKSSELVIDSKVNRLLKERANLSKLIKRERVESFKQLYSDTEKTFNPHKKIQKLETLALAEFQQTRITPKEWKVPPKFLNAPDIAKAKKDLAALNKAAIRDETGSITDFHPLIPTRFRNIVDSHPNVVLARKLLSNLEDAMLTLRSS